MPRFIQWIFNITYLFALFINSNLFYFPLLQKTQSIFQLYDFLIAVILKQTRSSRVTEIFIGICFVYNNFQLLHNYLTTSICLSDVYLFMVYSVWHVIEGCYFILLIYCRHFKLFHLAYLLTRFNPISKNRLIKLSNYRIHKTKPICLFLITKYWCLKALF